VCLVLAEFREIEALGMETEEKEVEKRARERNF
jgi:hypothetical protein